jgi:shikimate dehydrogenase
MITGRAALAGVIGWPVGHSRSPRLHNHWLARYDIDGAYVPLAVAPAALGAAVAGLRAAGFRGANVTVPHKEKAALLCTTLDASARRAGAVNTMVFDGAGIHGSNTDGAGFVGNLAAHGVRPDGPVLLLGAGGAARAIAACLLERGAVVTLCNRSAERAEALVAALPGLRWLPWEQRHAALADRALVVNTTSLGMQGQDELDLDLARAGPGLVVADIVYVPLRTRLLAQARAAGLTTVGGLGMLLHQAVPGFAAWFGVAPVVDQATYDLIAADIPPG